MAQQLPAKTENRPIALRDHIANKQAEFAKALPGHITPEKFVRTAQTAVAMTRNIDKVKNPQSLLVACSKAAADGLILDGREAALVVDYEGDVQYRPMMRGLLKLAYNSGAIKSIIVETVRENDRFDYSPTADEPIKHVIDLRADRGEVYAYYALARLKDGGILHEVMSTADVHRIRDRSDAWKAFKAGKIKSTPWHSDEIEMGRKTVFRRLSKYLPSSSDRDALHQAAERIDEDYTFEIDAEPVTNVTPLPTTKKRGGAAAALKNLPAKEPEQAGHDERNPPPHDPDTGEIIDPEDEEQQPGDDI